MLKQTFIPILFFLIYSFQINQKPVYKLHFTGVDCFFDLTVNDQFVYTNDHSYRVKRSLNINEYLEAIDSQKISFTITPRRNQTRISNKADFKAYILKEENGKTDTVLTQDPFSEHKESWEKVGYPALVFKADYFKTDKR